MLLPAEYSRVTPVTTVFDYLKGLNIICFDEGNDGGGDEYLLYWPVGREQSEPFVCLNNHGEALLTVPYCSLASFLASFDTDEYDLESENFFYFPYAQAKLRLNKGQIESAIEKLIACVNSFPEFSDAWALLATAYQQQGNQPAAAAAVRRALLSAWQFGMPSAQCVAVFQSVEISSHFAYDPLFLNRENLLTTSTYKQAAKNDYPRMWHIVQRYLELKDIESAIRLAQNYGYALHREPASLQSALQFSSDQWLAELVAIKQHLPA